jgi:LysR family transcriptional regulator, regulator for bpeEF and oprC
MKIRSDLFSGVLHFVRCAEQKSFSKAALDLGVTTAAVSKAIKKLEEDLGIGLFDRSSRTVELTRAGEVFLERCRSAVLNVQGAREAVRDTKSEPQGELAVSMSVILADLVVPLLPRLSAQYPRLTFRLNMSDRLVRLGGESIDVAIRMGDLEDSSLVSRLLRRTRWLTLGAPAYFATHAPPKTPNDIAAHNCLRFVGPSGRPRDWTFQDGNGTFRVKTEGNVTIDNGPSLLRAAEAGMGLVQALDFMAQTAVRDARLVEVLSAHAAPGPKIHAVSTRARASSPNVRAFVLFLVDVFGSWSRSDVHPTSGRRA